MPEAKQLDTREELAAYAHEAWSGWMRYLFGKGLTGTRGHVVLPVESVNRWTRQMNTDYTDLPESEKESDRAEADRMLAITRTDLVAPLIEAVEALEQHESVEPAWDWDAWAEERSRLATVVCDAYCIYKAKQGGGE